MFTDDKLRDYTTAVARVFQRTDRIVSGNFDLEVTVVDDTAWLAINRGLTDTAGWTDGESINLNAPVLANLVAAAETEDDKLDVLASFYGVNLHELAHVLFTPRVDEPICERVRTYGNKAWEVFNVLEDQRAETLFVAMYGPSRTHLRRLVLHQIVERNDPTDPWLLFLLWGRRYVSPELRKQYVIACEQAGKLDPSTVHHLLALIDEYRLLAYPRDEQRMEAIVLEFLDALMASSPQNLDDFANALKGTAAQHGAMESGMPDEDLNEEAAGAAESDAESESAEGDGEGDAEGDGEGDAESDANGDGESADTDSEGTGSDAQPAADETSSGSAEIEAAVREALESSRQESKEDIRSIAESVREAEKEARTDVWADGMSAEGRAHDVTGVEKVAKRRVTRALNELRAELEAGWIKQQSTGRLNVQSVLNAAHGDFDVWDRFDPGAEEATDVELVLLIDVSGSMAHPVTVDDWKDTDQLGKPKRTKIREASRAAWVLHSAVTASERGRVTVIGFSDAGRHMVLYGPNDRPRTNTWDEMPTVSSTDPLSALQQATRIVRRSDRSIKLVAVLTDGQWSRRGRYDAAGNYVETDEYEAEFAAQRAAGATTALFAIGEGLIEKYGDHGAQLAHVVTNPMELVAAVQRLTARAALRTAELLSG